MVNSVVNSSVASNYILRRESYLPTATAVGQNWTLDRHWNVGRELPLITVTPATDERRRRQILPLTTTTTTITQTYHPRPRDYTAIYAWSPELPAATTAVTSIKRSSTFGDGWNVNGYVEPVARYRGAPPTPPERRTLPSSIDNNRAPTVFAAATSFSSCGGDFVDMRGICRSVVSPADLLQIELFYRSHRTEVVSCACAARLYFAAARRHSSIPGSTTAVATQPEVVVDAARWYPTTAVGVPVIVLDCGGSRCRDRKLNLVTES